MLLVASLAAALVIQFFGGGLVKTVDVHNLEPSGSAGDYLVSLEIEVKWPVTIPTLLGSPAIVCFVKRGNERTDRTT